MKENFVYRSRCELCDSDRKQTLISIPFSDSLVWDFLESYYQSRIDKSVIEGTNYEVVECLDCKFVWQAYVCNDQLMDELYNVWIPAELSLKKQKYANASLYNNHAYDLIAVSYLFSEQPYKISILDFGMGWGHWCRMAKAFGYSVKGFEVSAPRLAYAREIGIDVIDNYSDIGKDKFDFINSEQVFEHITNPLQTLNYLSSSLKTGGIIRISVPNGSIALKQLKHSSQKNWKATKNELHPLEHINCFTHSTLRAMGKRANLECINLIHSIRKSRKETILNVVAMLTGQNRSKDTQLYFRKVHD